MAHSDDGQYELVLENKQVLGIFFIAALLCGVFFGFGFLVGRSSKGPTGTQPVTPSSADATSESRRSAMPQDKSASQPDAVTPDAQPASGKAADKDKPADAAASTPPPAEEKPKAEEKTAPAPAPQPETASINLQVNVFSSPDAAEPVASLLKRKNFPVTVAQGTSDKYYHVLVGPYPNMKEADAVKKRLEEEGFKPIVKK